MKFASAFFVLASAASPVLSAGTRNAHQETQTEPAFQVRGPYVPHGPQNHFRPGVHGSPYHAGGPPHVRHLDSAVSSSMPISAPSTPTTSASTSTYKGLDASSYWISPGCNDFVSSIYVSASLSTTTSDIDGASNSTDYDNAYISVDTYTDCNGDTATHTYAYINVIPGDGTLELASDLTSGSYSVTTTDTNSSYVTETCTKVCMDYDDDYYTDLIGQSSYCYFGNCTILESTSGSFDVEATWTGDGSTPNNYTSNSKYYSANYMSVSTSEGQDRPATTTLSIMFEGAELVPADANITGTISDSSSTDTYNTM